MSFPSFTPFTFFSTLFFVFSLLVIAKMLTLDWKLDRRESIYLALATLFASTISVLNRDISAVFSHTFGDFSMLLILFFYFRKVHAYSRKKSIILTFAASYINITMLYISKLTFYFLFADFDASFNPDFVPDVSGQISFLEIWQVFSYLPFFIAATLLFLWLSRGIRPIISQNERLQMILSYAGVIILSLFHILVTSFRFLGYEDWLVSPRTALFTLLVLFFLLFVYLLTKFMTAKHERLQRENEQRSLLFYTEELERQQIAVQKFKHDYQNILLSMRAFIQEKDWAGLEQYFSSKIAVASEAITRDSFALQALCKIKVQEIKSILAAKLMVAQNTNIGIQTTFEANEEIDNIPIDSIVLVRMLGIILDNAIEALEELNGGKLFVGCYTWEGGITFVVQNTCRPDLPPLYELLQAGFSTKGEKRGLGLSNLAEIADSCPNVMLETKIEKDRFIQTLLIEGARRS